MITAAHAIIYADDPEQARAFFRDVLEMPNVDIHGGWLIFKLPAAELGIHPSGEGSPGGHHELFLMCDDIDSTVAGAHRQRCGVLGTDQHHALRTPHAHANPRWRDRRVCISRRTRPRMTSSSKRVISVQSRRWLGTMSR